ncbi:hypothetical protein PILCRDRAFT_796979 [Piloderma croceum F 1598]|uniref:Nephrocystin 3-like N-terminal domain-containing protein n=1 Tax=Piloderma croceum (strain F 1598) TaxID=765440 RepID=A0A0C3EW23_PILCF|nr:hypothetical protein PILCRDRAFT_796979 [Piloderma croceum F 1598]
MHQDVLGASSAPEQTTRTLWLYGLAGSGKSTLSTTIANIFNELGQLGAFLFFDRDVTERSDPTMFVMTLAYQLASSDPKIGAHVRAVVEKNSNILLSSLALQFQRLILDPLSSVCDPIAQIIIVIDALDECGTAQGRSSLLDILTNGFSKLPSYVRTIVLSRVEIDDGLQCFAIPTPYSHP